MILEVMLADDHAVVRDGLKQLLTLEKQYRVIASVGSAEEIMAQCRNRLPDLVILDLSMPGMGGIEATRRLLSKWPKLKIIIFSTYQNPRLVQRVLNLGGSGYITKNSESHVIIEGIAAVMAGKQFVSPDIDILLNTKPVGQLYSLTPKEFDIFRCIADGLGNKQISEKLFLSEKTIANNISFIKKKLNVDSTTALLHIAIKEGLLLTDY